MKSIIAHLKSFIIKHHDCEKYLEHCGSFSRKEHGVIIEAYKEYRCCICQKIIKKPYEGDIHIFLIKENNFMGEWFFN